MRTFLLSVLLLAAPAAAQSIETVNGVAIPDRQSLRHHPPRASARS